MNNQEAGMPLLTENTHSESLLAGSCLEWRELWRMVRVFGQPIKHIQSIGWATTWAEKADCTRYVLYVTTTNRTLPYFTLRATLSGGCYYPHFTDEDWDYTARQNSPQVTQPANGRDKPIDFKACALSLYLLVPTECFQCRRHSSKCITRIISFTPTVGVTGRYC